TLQQLISDTMVRWAQESVIEDPELVRAMFVLLHRQYDGIGGLVRALPKTYTINSVSVEDTINLLASLGQIRSLLSVRMGKEEEKLMIRGLGGEAIDICKTSEKKYIPVFTKRVIDMFWQHFIKAYVSLLKLAPLHFFLCTVNVFPMNLWFIKLVLKLNVILTASPSMRGSTPLDVAAASVMDNNELALALREPDLEKVVRYLAGCGLQSCPLLICKGYPDIGWNPVEGERYLDFLRFAVFCNGESVEENANVVVRLLIR
ncbi:RYR2 protein, partial [Peucedramus taeniatus]|nr:RYR2 protein [Peucedramus taeniatus]